MFASSLLHSSPLGSYKELLRGCYGLKAKSQGSGSQVAAEDPSQPCLQVHRGIGRVQAEITVSRDPVGAFSRLAYRLNHALGVGDGRGEVWEAGLRASFRRASATTDDEDEGRQTAVADTLGSEGPVRRAVVAAMCAFSRAFMRNLNHTTVLNEQQLRAAVDRPEGTALITICNHVSVLDDPVLMGALVPPDVAAEPRKLRWGMCAADRCFNKGRLAEAFCRAGKVLKTERGAGLEQPAMWAAEKQLGAGDWVHIFPEGTRSKDGGRTLGRVRWGVGRLVVSCPKPPIVLPFVHRGLENIMPRGKVVPRLGQQVDVLFGEPVPIEDLWQAWHAGRLPDEACYAQVASRLQLALAKLKAEIDGAEFVSVDEGVVPGILGEREPSRWNWPWRSPAYPSPASFARNHQHQHQQQQQQQGASLEGWGPVLVEHAKLLGLDLPAVSSSTSPAAHQQQQQQGGYSLQRAREMFRILSTAG